MTEIDWETKERKFIHFELNFKANLNDMNVIKRYNGKISIENRGREREKEKEEGLKKQKKKQKMADHFPEKFIEFWEYLSIPMKAQKIIFQYPISKCFHKYQRG